MSFSAAIDSVIRIDRHAMPEKLSRAIERELMIRNPEKERATSERVRGAQEMPDWLSLARYSNFELIIPRGFAHRLEELAGQYGTSIAWKSGMTLVPFSQRRFADWVPAQLRDYQIAARDALLDYVSGILMAPVGSGKTIISLEVARWAGQPTLIIVGKTSLASQWVERAREQYGYEAGYIGEGKWEERDLTIAVWQTLWSRRESIENDFWKRWGMVIGDEVHHHSSASLSELIQCFTAFYRLGVSATPEWDPDRFPVIKAVIGPVAHRTTHADVGDRLIAPRVEIIRTDFYAEYKPTRVVGRRRVQNNYSEIMSTLCDDPARCDLIASIARRQAQEGHHVLVVTRRLDQLREILGRLEKPMKLGRTLHVLTGAQTGADATRVAKSIAACKLGTVLLSTVADEALDIPRLDRIIMAFPLRRVPLVEQQIGRVMRPTAGKTDAVVYDLADTRIPVIKAQMSERLQRLYMKRGWAINFSEAREAMAA